VTPLERFASVCHTTQVAHPFQADADLPMLTPSNERELREVLRCVARDDLAALPVGSATKLPFADAPARLDVLISTHAMRQVIAFEPGDGTLTAQAGARLSALAELAQSGGRDLVPRYAESTQATLGGAIATGEMGSDRLRRGALREHVLGLRVMLSDGTTSRSGGRLVKNVAGYDLHRLHTGAWGGLGLILEATLRLFPQTRSRETFCLRLEDVRAAADMARTIQGARLGAERVWVTWLDHGVVLSVTLAGRPDVVANQAERVRTLSPDWRVSTDAQPVTTASFTPHVAWQTLPSHALALLECVEEIQATAPDARLEWEPLLAQLSLTLPHTATVRPGTTFGEARFSTFPIGSALRELRAIEHSADVQLWPRARRTEPSPRLALERQLEDALDPKRLWAKLV
jgi:FAD/FMN-containing dehydrogenase